MFEQRVYSEKLHLYADDTVIQFAGEMLISTRRPSEQLRAAVASPRIGSVRERKKKEKEAKKKASW